MKVLFVSPNKDTFGYKPIGLSLLSAIAREHGWESRLFDTTEIDLGYIASKEAFEDAKIFRPVDSSSYGLEKKKIDLEEKVEEVLEEYRPDLMAFSVLSEQFIVASRISRQVKRIMPDLPVIWGGAYATLNPELTLHEHRADFVCLGEGIEAFADFLAAMSGNRSPDNIPNIWIKRNGSVLKNDIRPLKRDLDDLPYIDWTIFDKRQFYKPFQGKMVIGGDHMMNWGCPYNCTYCINHFYHEMYENAGKYPIRRYSIPRIVAELKYLKDKYHLEFFKFFDEDILMRPVSNLRELSELYRKEVNLPFAAETNPKSVTEERAELLKNMNCASVALGVETGDSDRRKNLLNRVDSEEDIIRAYSILRDTGIMTSAYHMLGLPGETRDTYMKTVELNRKAQPQYPQATFFYPFEGTRLRDVAIKEGFFDPEDRETVVFRYDKPALHFPGLTDEELIQMQKVFVLYIKLPEEYEPFIRRSETLDETGIALRKKLLDIYDNTVWKNDGWYIDDGNSSVYLKELNDTMQGVKNS